MNSGDVGGPKISGPKPGAVKEEETDQQEAPEPEHVENSSGLEEHGSGRNASSKDIDLRIGTLNVGTMTGKGRELAHMMERRRVDVLCVQETRWKDSKSFIGGGYTLYNSGVDGKRNGVGVILKKELCSNVLKVKRVSDRVMRIKLKIKGVKVNVVSGYAPHVGRKLKEKKRFWSKFHKVIRKISKDQRLVIGADFNGHVGEGNKGDEDVMGRFGLKKRNLAGQMVVDFAKRMEMAIVNTYYEMSEEHRVTYKSGGRSTQVDYILCRQDHLREVSDCKVVVVESVAKQHRMVVCEMNLKVHDLPEKSARRPPRRYMHAENAMGRTIYEVAVVSPCNVERLLASDLPSELRISSLM